jgi:hypothetical protein
VVVSRSGPADNPSRGAADSRADRTADHGARYRAAGRACYSAVPISKSQGRQSANCQS